MPARKINKTKTDMSIMPANTKNFERFFEKKEKKIQNCPKRGINIRGCINEELTSEAFTKREYSVSNTKAAFVFPHSI